MVINNFFNKINFLRIFSSLKILKNILIKNYSKYPNYVIDFERKISKKFNSQYGLTFANATIATQCAMKSMGLKKGDEILISKLCFPSTFLAILRSGFKPILADFDENLNIILNNNIYKKKLKAFCISFLFGYPLDIRNINFIKKAFPNIKIISDCSHAHGAKIDNKDIINFADISVMSLQGSKAISGGEGGMAFTNNKEYFNSMINLCHPSRDNLGKKLKHLYPGYSKLVKGRMHPLAALIAAEDLKYLDYKNKKIREKLSCIYSILKNNKKIYLPNIIINNTGGYHFGFPFIISKDKKKIIEKINFTYHKYNYPKYEYFKEFSSKENFDEYLEKNIDLDYNYFKKKNTIDIRDNIYFIDLNWIKSNSLRKIKINFLKFKKMILNDL